MTVSERVGLEYCKRCAACDRAFCCHHAGYREYTFRTNLLPSQLPAALPQTACCLLPFLSITLPVDYSEFNHRVVRDVWFEIYFLPLEKLNKVSVWTTTSELHPCMEAFPKLLTTVPSTAGSKVCCPHCSFWKNQQLYLNVFLMTSLSLAISLFISTLDNFDKRVC